MSHLKPFLFVFLIFMGVVLLGSEPVGAESEAFHWLMDNGYILKSYYHLSKSDWSGSGYYCQAVEDKGYRIVEVR